MDFILLTQQGGILKPFAWILGKILEGIYFVCSSIGIESIGLCIILFTFIVRLVMLPSSIKQQKSVRLNTVIAPEIQAIQKKYEKRKDQKSQMQMQQEVSDVYQKYGTSPMGSCLQLIIQFPIMITLYRVIQNIPAYVGRVKDYYVQIINHLSATQIKDFFGISVQHIKDLTSTQINSIVDSMSGYQLAKGVKAVDLGTLVSSVDNPVITNAYHHIRNINDFFIYNLSDSPKEMWATIGALALVIPILSGVLQLVFTQISMKMNAQMSDNSAGNPAMSSMKIMNYLMPLMSVWMCWQFSSGLGIYWIANTLFMMIQYIFIDLHFKKLSLDDIIEENQKKAAKKRAKKGVPEHQINNAAAVHAKSISANTVTEKKEKEEKLDKAREYYQTHAGEHKDSISSRANMVKDFDKRNGRKN